MAIRSAWESSALALRIARRSCASVCHSARFRPAAEMSTRRFNYWSSDWLGTVYWSTASDARESGEDLVVIEPQLPDYWPRMPPLRNADTLVLSRFAYMRRRGNEMVLELPRAGALFRICNPKIATALALLSTPQQIKQLRRQDSFPGLELLALLVDCQILFKTEAAGDSGPPTDRG